MEFKCLFSRLIFVFPGRHQATDGRKQRQGALQLNPRDKARYLQDLPLRQEETHRLRAFEDVRGRVLDEVRNR